MLGEDGTRLSGGQRQRVALARAFLKKSSILILDEPTSSLDYETEIKIQKTFDDLAADGRVTLIVIAHRLSTIRKADLLIVLAEGRVVDAASPADLADRESWYRDVLAIQAG